MTPKQCLIKIKSIVPAKWKMMTRKYDFEWLADAEIENLYIVVSCSDSSYSYGIIDSSGIDSSDGKEYYNLDDCLVNARQRLDYLLKKEEEW